MFLLLALHLLIGVVIVATGDRWGRRAFAVAALAPLATLGWAVSKADGVLDGRPVTERFTWVAGLDLALDLRLDAFGLVMVALVSGIGLLVCIYAMGYFSHPKPGTARLAGLMTMFAGAMLGVVLADHLLVLFICWELTSITSYLLIGNDDRNPRARAAALQAILITGSGGLVLLFGLVIIGQAAGTYRLSELIAEPPSGGAVAAGLVCVLIGAFTKSAQAPFGSWLPGAMVAPTPISAYLHSATMVKAGVYLVARLAPIVAAIGPWRPLLLVVGSATMLIGGLRALRQYDLKLLLAHGTVSQLGFLMLLLGTGEYKIAQAGVMLLLAHAAFKAALFMVVGIVDHEAGTRDIRELHGFGAGWRPVLVIGVIGAASMAGLPPLVGFIAKEKALDGYVEYGDFGGATAVLVVIVLGSILTFAYSARFVLGILGRFGRDDREVVSRSAHAPTVAFWAPAAVLTVFTVAAGLAPVLVDRLVRAATLAIDPAASPSTVKLWAGFNTAFVLSLVVIGTGVLLVLARGPVARLQYAIADRIRWIPTTDAVFLASLRGLTSTAKWTARIVQNGSLPIYLSIILITAATVPVLPLLGELRELPVWVDAPIHLPLVILMIAGALAASFAKRRIAAALFLGSVGYAMAGFYVSLGDPDLALTQFAIETLGTVLFVLVMRFLPTRWDRVGPASATPARLLVSVVVGAAVFVFALTASDARTDVSAPSISEEMIERSAPEAKGNNVVNVILVDFRGLDTLGEITVLVVAAVGAVGLARVGRRPTRPEDGDETPAGPVDAEPIGPGEPVAVTTGEVRS
jgi:multicomponent Na+:H+ antiporter subunit A